MRCNVFIINYVVFVWIDKVFSNCCFISKVGCSDLGFLVCIVRFILKEYVDEIVVVDLIDVSIKDMGIIIFLV